jgi:hypothetical protein
VLADSDGLGNQWLAYSAQAAMQPKKREEKIFFSLPS